MSKPRQPVVGVENAAIGNTNKIIIADTDAHEGDFFCIVALTDVVFDEIIDPTITEGTMAGVTLLANGAYFGNITSISLTSGTCIAYEFSQSIAQ